MFHDHHLTAGAADLDDLVAGIGHNGGPDLVPEPVAAPEPARDRKSIRCLPDSYFHGKDIILRRCVEVIGQQGLGR